MGDEDFHTDRPPLGDEDYGAPPDDGYAIAPDEQPLGPAAHVPPHDADAERAVLGALMLSDQARYGLTIEDGLLAEDFYVPKHQAVYAAIRALYSRNDPVDSVTVVDYLRQTDTLEQAGGREEVLNLVSAVTEVAALPRHAKIVQERSALRRLLGASHDIQGDVLRDRDPARDIVDRAQRAVLEITREEEYRGLQQLGTFIDEEIQHLEKLEAAGTDITGLASGFAHLDKLTAGFQPGSLIVIGARPAMGKSALVTNLAENVSMGANRRAVALFSLEMPKREIFQRIIASQASIKGDDVRKGNIGERWGQILETADDIARAPLYIDDSSDISITEIRAKARRLNATVPGGLGLVVVDYLQLMRPEGRTENRVQQIGEMSRGLKILAQELSCPVIVLSQLSRQVENRPDKRPMLSDLRESGSVEQDADIVTFIYRDEYYNAATTEPGIAELIVAKNRSGSTDTVRLLFQSEYPRFLTLAQQHQHTSGPSATFTGGPPLPNLTGTPPVAR